MKTIKRTGLFLLAFITAVTLAISIALFVPGTARTEIAANKESSVAATVEDSLTAGYTAGCDGFSLMAETKFAVEGETDTSGEGEENNQDSSESKSDKKQVIKENVWWIVAVVALAVIIIILLIIIFALASRNKKLEKDAKEAKKLTNDKMNQKYYSRLSDYDDFLDDDDSDDDLDDFLDDDFSDSDDLDDDLDDLF